MYLKIIKPIFDFLFSFFVLLLISPILIIVTLLLFFANSGKPFFFQTRPGKNEKLFKIIKFKTMNDKMDIEGKLLPDDKRLTKVGQFVRKTSIDELPQFINILKGDMSVVGPRPLLPEYLNLYNENQKRRHNVRPGVTGLTQVSGRNANTWEEKFNYDIKYVDNISFINDLKIILKTFKKVIISEGISAEGSQTSEKFKGTA
ncbi:MULTISPECIES: sugar transferase [Tenacibaculum]|uniref:sugar transferase n=1 Tax=Tenacibaculum TaxID=104267 RepID=UPI001F0B6B16|nr:MULTISPECIES: sugar transferase [Tenacibaculum]MCH3883142.1 sugar transferase [Tenacibaculum aquimarinum]MDO6600880.1 sugar transferase [Tenacibaculum sp. 1_MG-2023]